MNAFRQVCVLAGLAVATACAGQPRPAVTLSHGFDDSAGSVPAYIVKTRSATYFLEKQGGGLSSMVDRDGVDWLGFHNKPGSAHKGEYRGFPNAVHKQDGNFFHAMTASTDASRSRVDVDTGSHVRITVTSGNGTWEGRYDFYPDRLDFSMTKISPGFHYWVQYEGVPGGNMDSSDFRISSADDQRHLVETPFAGDLPAPEWMAFGDQSMPRVLYLYHHEDDSHPDDYAHRPDMTVFAFGRRNKNKFLNEPQTFSIGFIESTDYREVEAAIRAIASLPIGNARLPVSNTRFGNKLVAASATLTRSSTGDLLPDPRYQPRE